MRPGPNFFINFGNLKLNMTIAFVLIQTLE